MSSCSDKHPRLTRVPNLRLDRLSVHLNGPGSEFYSDSRLRVEIELVPGETRKHCSRQRDVRGV